MFLLRTLVKFYNSAIVLMEYLISVALFTLVTFRVRGGDRGCSAVCNYREILLAVHLIVAVLNIQASTVLSRVALTYFLPLAEVGFSGFPLWLACRIDDVLLFTDGLLVG